jgi:hypothetical protein
MKQRLLATGFSVGQVWVIEPHKRPGQLGSSAQTVPSQHDRNEEREGSFADVDPVYHDRNQEREGSFADGDPIYHDRNQERKGSFADSEPIYHDRNVERQGSFADTKPAGSTEFDPELEELRQAGLPEENLEAYASYLRQNQTLLIVQTDEQGVARIHSILHDSVAS